MPINHLMEDAATAEISRAQLWQWLRHKATLEDGELIDKNLIEKLLEEQASELASLVDERALILFKQMVFCEDFEEFLTVPAYDLLD